MTAYTVIAASRAFFAGRRKGVAAPGPDEDLFTLGVATGELLEPTWRADPSSAPRVIWVSGDLTPKAAEDLPIALGVSSAAVLAAPEVGSLPAHSGVAPGPNGVLWLQVGGRGTEPTGCATALLLTPPTGAAEGPPRVESVADLANLIHHLESGPSDPDHRPGPTKLGEWADVPSVSSGPSPGEPAAIEPSLDAVSEGAYLSWPSYREGLSSRWRFAAERCSNCGHRTFPARGQCESCGERSKLEREELPRDKATVEAITTVHAGAQPSEFDFQVDRGGSYDVALIRPAPGVLITVQLTDSLPGALRVGDPVETCLRRLYPMEGHWRYGRKARPRKAAAESR